MERSRLPTAFVQLLCLCCFLGAFSLSADSVPARVAPAINKLNSGTQADPATAASYRSPASASKPHIVIISGGNGGGLGDFTYGVKIHQFLRHHFSGNTYTLLMYGSEDNQKKIGRVYGLTETNSTDFLWVLDHSDSLTNGEEGVDEQEKLRVQHKLQSLPSANVRYIFVAAIEDSGGSGYHFITSELGITPDLTLKEMAYPEKSHGQSLEVLHEVLTGLHRQDIDPEELTELFWLTDETGTPGNFGTIGFST